MWCCQDWLFKKSKQHLNKILRSSISHKFVIFDAVVKNCRKKNENDDNKKNMMLNIAAICFIFILEFEVEGAFVILFNCIVKWYKAVMTTKMMIDYFTV